MSVAVPSIEPLEIRAGTFAEWTKSLGDYSYADGWRLTYYLRGPAELNLATIAASDGRSFSATILTSQSTALAAGDYWMAGIVTLNDDSRQVYAGSLKVLPNFATLTAGYDGRTHARRMLDSLESAQLGAGGNRIVSYSIDGERSVTLMSTDQWMTEFAFWEDRVAWERKGEMLGRGRRIGIGIRFTNA